MSNQYDYDELTSLACDNISTILERLSVDYKQCGKRIVGNCSIHEGDNSSAWNLYPDGYKMRGYWACYTQHCEEKWGKDLVGFLRGVISSKLGKLYSREQVIKWLCKVLDYELKEIPANKRKSNQYSELTNVLEDVEDEELSKEIGLKVQSEDDFAEKNTENGWTPGEVRQILEIPADYYIKRGYLPDLLKKYDIGLNPKYNRVMVPIFNQGRDLVHGFVGRSIFEKCTTCKLYHTGPCPKDERERLYAAKWRTNKGMYTSNYLFNLWFARPYIEETGTVILVEGVGDVLKLEEAGIHNAVSLFGIHLYPRQLQLLQQLNITRVVSILDNDSAGKYGNNIIREKLGKVYYLHFPALSAAAKDIGDMTVEEIRNLKLGE